MTTMSIDNHLTQRSQQFIGIGVNKLTFKSINKIHLSNNYNFISDLVCWKQNIHSSYEKPGYLVIDDEKKI